MYFVVYFMGFACAAVLFGIVELVICKLSNDRADCGNVFWLSSLWPFTIPYVMFQSVLYWWRKA